MRLNAEHYSWGRDGNDAIKVFDPAMSFHHAILTRDIGGDEDRGIKLSVVM